MGSDAAPTEPASVSTRRLLDVVEARFADGLAAALPPVARGPIPGRTETAIDALRAAYLDLLKLALADLVSTTTSSVIRNQLGDVMTRELAGPDLNARAAGLDWPLHGLTMLGLARLNDLQHCVEQIVKDRVPGDLIEAGSWRGGAAMLMRATLDALGAAERTVWVADSFQGFPAAPPDAEKDGYDLWADLASADFLAVPQQEVEAAFTRLGLSNNVNFVPGFFQDTLPPLTGHPWSLIRLDGDTYESVRIGLEALYPSLSVGGYVVIDDYSSLDECREAVQDYRREYRIQEPIDEIDWNGVRWQRQRQTEALTARTKPTDAPESKRHAPTAVPRGPRKRIPALAEVELQEELARVQERLDRAEAELRRIERSPLAGPAAWVRAATRDTPLAVPLRKLSAAARRIRIRTRRKRAKT